MQIQVNADQSIHGHDAMATWVHGVVEEALVRVEDYITRVEVHVSDENGQKQGLNDKRCTMEARLEGFHPIAVTHHAATVNLAVKGAAAKLFRLVTSTLERQRLRRPRRSAPSSAEYVIMTP